MSKLSRVFCSAFMRSMNPLMSEMKRFPYPLLRKPQMFKVLRIDIQQNTWGYVSKGQTKHMDINYTNAHTWIHWPTGGPFYILYSPLFFNTTVFIGQEAHGLKAAHTLKLGNPAMVWEFFPAHTFSHHKTLETSNRIKYKNQHGFAYLAILY